MSRSLNLNFGRRSTSSYSSMRAVVSLSRILRDGAVRTTLMGGGSCGGGCAALLGKRAGRGLKARKPAAILLHRAVRRGTP